MPIARLPYLAVLTVLSSCSLGSNAELNVRAVGAETARFATAAEAYQAGKKQLSAGSSGLAIDLFRKAVRLDPASVDALNGLAVAYDRIGRFDLSRRYYEQALGIDPRSAVVLHNFGYSLARQGQVSQGRELIAQAAELADPIVQPKANHLLASLSGTAVPSARFVAPRTASSIQQWIERTTDAVQTLVTTATPVKMAGSEVEPRLRNVHAVAAIAAPAQRPAVGVFLSTAQAVAEMAASEAETQLADGSPPRELTPVVVVNAVGRGRMATRLGGYLSGHGVTVAGLWNGRNQGRMHSVIRFAPASRSAAVAVAQLLPFRVGLEPTNVPTGAVQLILGRNALGFDDKLIQQRREG